MRHEFMFTSESVTAGHPDKLCDRVSDAVLDAFLETDPRAKVRAECAMFKDIVFIASRFASSGAVDFARVARRVLAQAGYGEDDDFNPRTCSILTTLQEMSLPRSYAFEEGELTEQAIEAMGARHQVTVFGYACTQTETLMPLPIFLAHRLARRVSEVRASGLLPYLMPEAKVQVGVTFEKRSPVRIHGITILASRKKRGPGLARMRDDIRQAVVEEVLKAGPLQPDGSTKINVNPEGEIGPGGPPAHSGLTGRKNAVDTYGEYCRQSEKALSGKDPLRIDRTGAYAARYAAKNLVAAGLATECEVQLSYAIGEARPVSIVAETHGTGCLPENELAELVARHIELRPAGILRNFGLRRLPAANPEGYYSRLAVYGHMGRTDLEVPWERLDAAAVLRNAAASAGGKAVVQGMAR